MQQRKKWIALALVCVSLASSGCITAQLYSWPAPVRTCPIESDVDWLVDRYRDWQPAALELDERMERWIGAAVYCRSAARELKP